jgi:hypothetical protein
LRENCLEAAWRIAVLEVASMVMILARCVVEYVEAIQERVKMDVGEQGGEEGLCRCGRCFSYD